MVLDHRLRYLMPVRNTLTAIVAPVQYMVSAPVKWVSEFNSSLQNRQVLLTQNAALRGQQLLLQAKLQQLLALQNENTQLRALLASLPRVENEHVVVAQLLAVDTEPLVSEMVLDKGQHDGVYVGQPVLDAKGIVGQIIQVGPLTSRLMLITDPRSAIPVQNTRNAIRGIIVGRGNLSKLALTDIPNTVDVKMGDVLVSSGLGGHYPPGYPVGTVNQVRYTTGKQFTSIGVTPTADLDRNQQVLLLWPVKMPTIDAPKSSLPPVMKRRSS